MIVKKSTNVPMLFFFLKEPNQSCNPTIREPNFAKEEPYIEMSHIKRNQPNETTPKE